jgi:hypothetical protein
MTEQGAWDRGNQVPITSVAANAIRELRRAGRGRDWRTGQSRWARTPLVWRPTNRYP